ncbi:MAG TPA: hypothetical protein QGI39_08410 [Gammaproteobacteria bacterium]|nr:hypothetical protein [Gammaproteobacteria bacterium]
MSRLREAVLTNLFLLFGVLPGLVLAQDSTESTATEDSTSATTENNRPIEQIIVTGDEELFVLRQRIRLTEENIFKLFNANNSADKYDIVCKKIAPIGSHIRRRVCEPKFLTEMRGQNTRDYRAGSNVLFDKYDLRRAAAADMEALQAEIFALMENNEEYATELARYAELTEHYETTRIQQLNDD